MNRKKSKPCCDLPDGRIFDSRLPNPRSKCKPLCLPSDCKERWKPWERNKQNHLGFYFFKEKFDQMVSWRGVCKSTFGQNHCVEFETCIFFHRCRAPIWTPQQFESWNFMFLKRFPEIVVEVGMFQDCNGCFWGTATSEVLRPTLHLWGCRISPWKNWWWFEVPRPLWPWCDNQTKAALGHLIFVLHQSDEFNVNRVSFWMMNII